MSLYMRRKNMNKWMISAWFFDGFLFIYILKKKKKHLLTVRLFVFVNDVNIGSKMY